MKQGIIFGILTTLLSVVLVFSSGNLNLNDAQVVLIHDGEEIFSSPFLETGEQIIWYIEDHEGNELILKDQEIIDYFELDISVEDLLDLSMIDFDKIYAKIGTDAHLNMIVNKDGYVMAYEANCPDKLDVKMGKIYNSTKVITCVPHKLVIKIEGVEDTAGGVDA